MTFYTNFEIKSTRDASSIIYYDTNNVLSIVFNIYKIRGVMVLDKKLTKLEAGDYGLTIKQIYNWRKTGWISIVMYRNIFRYMELTSQLFKLTVLYLCNFVSRRYKISEYILKSETCQAICSLDIIWNISLTFQQVWPKAHYSQP